MKTIAYVQALVCPDAAALLPSLMASREALAMLLAIGLQESRFEHRRQIGGPARGWWQFELGGVKACNGRVCWGVLAHPQSRPHLLAVLPTLGYRDDAAQLYGALEHNDVLACVLARLLLWTHPRRLPREGETQYAWDYYLDLWRPGKPHPQTWAAIYKRAGEMLR